MYPVAAEGTNIGGRLVKERGKDIDGPGLTVVFIPIPRAIGAENLLGRTIIVVAVAVGLGGCARTEAFFDDFLAPAECLVLTRAGGDDRIAGVADFVRDDFGGVGCDRRFDLLAQAAASGQ